MLNALTPLSNFGKFIFFKLLTPLVPKLIPLELVSLPINLENLITYILHWVN